jgi:hypothetical protein
MSYISPVWVNFKLLWFLFQVQLHHASAYANHAICRPYPFHTKGKACPIHVTPWFSKIIEFYKVIFVAFIPLHIFLGVIKCSCILLCEYKSLKFKFDLNSNWFVIYETDLKKNFLFKISFWAESNARPSRLIWAVNPVANGRRLMKFVGPWAGGGGPGARCCGHILRFFHKENNSIILKNRWNLGILQKHHWTFS